MAITGKKVIAEGTISRLDDFKAALTELISVNKQLEKATLDVAKASNTKQQVSASNRLLLIEKKRKSAIRALNKEAKKNNDITNYRIKSNINLRKTLNEVTRATKKQEAEVRKLNSTNKKSTSILKKSVAMLKQGAVAAVAFFGIRKANDLVQKALETTKKLDSLRLTLETVLKTERAILVTEQFLMDLSNDYGANIITLTERYIKFQAAANQSNITMKDTRKIYESMVKAAGIMGLSTHELEGALLAIEQMMSKGKITTEELRRQLGERMPGAMGIMADAVGVSVSKLDEMLKKGEVLSSEVLPKFADALEKAYGIEQVDKIDTLVAAQTRNSNAWITFIKNVESGEGRISKVLISVYNGLAKLANVLTPEDTLGDRKKIANSFFDDTYDEYESNATRQLEMENKLLDDESKNSELIKNRMKENAEKELENAKEILKIKKDNYEDIASQYKVINETIEKFRQDAPFFSIDAENQEGDLLITQSNIKKQLDEASYELGRLQGILKALEDMQLQVKANSDGGGGKKPKYKFFNRKDLTIYSKQLLLMLNEEKKIYLDIAKNNNKNYKQRLDAINDILNVSKQIIDVEKSDKLAKIDAKYEKELDRLNKFEHKKGLITKSELEKINKYKLDLNKKYIYDKQTAELEFDIKLRSLYSDRLKDELNIYTQYLKDKSSITKNNLSKERDDILSAESELYIQKEINEKEYKKRIKKINSEYRKREIEADLISMQELLGIYEKINRENNGGEEKRISELKAKISELQLALKKLGVEGFDDTKEKFKEFYLALKNGLVDLVNEIGNLINSIYDANIANLENNLVHLNEFYDEQKELAENDAVRKKQLEDEEKIRKDKLNKEIKAEQIKQAKAQKAFSIFNATISTAEAVVKFLANPGGVHGVILSALAGVTGAMQIAAIASQPIPQYKYGTEYHIGGPAIIDDGGRSEVVVEPNKNPVVSKGLSPQLVNLAKGTKVYSSIDEYRKKTFTDATNRFTQSTTGDVIINQPDINNNVNVVVEAPSYNYLFYKQQNQI